MWRNTKKFSYFNNLSFAYRPVTFEGDAARLLSTLLEAFQNWIRMTWCLVASESASMVIWASAGRRLAFVLTSALTVSMQRRQFSHMLRFPISASFITNGSTMVLYDELVLTFWQNRHILREVGEVSKNFEQAEQILSPQRLQLCLLLNTPKSLIYCC